MDIEPGVGMLTGADVLHGHSHTILGAIAIAFLVRLVAPGICKFLLRNWNNEVIHHKLSWLAQSDTPSRTAMTASAFFGTLSHVVLDSLIHHDIQPLFPFSNGNPLMGLVSHDGVYQLCAIAGVLGTIACVAMQWFLRPA
ncbi:metal-dependent hydrolase [Rhodoferax sp.]|uniref:metal-dependent hydrolase n=1 Tax=Rhodoferax sp. TaxID=50421 RepID=UPI0026381F52|nr:metal-dependent hydrolase [Rhodoferax sp.]